MSETLYDLLKQTQAVKRVLGETAMTKPRAVQDVLVSPQLRSRMRLVIKDAESREHEFGGFLVGHYDGKDLRLDDFYEHRREGAREHVRLEGRFDPSKIIANWHTHPSYAMPEPSDQDLTVFADASEQFQHFSIIVHGGTLTVYDGEETVWEGKWAEGVEESKSLKVTAYHGTDVAFDKFDMSFADEGGFFFTDVLEQAQDYGSTIIKARLTIKKPYTMPYKKWQDTTEPTVEALRKKGYDGIVITDFDSATGDTIHEDRGNAYLVFSPEQIKILDKEVRESVNEDVDQTYPTLRWVRQQMRWSPHGRIRHPVLDAFIVGSEAKGTAKPDSDLDIAVVIPPIAGKTALKYSEHYHSNFMSDAEKPKWNGRIVDFQFFYPDDPELKGYSKIPLREDVDGVSTGGLLIRIELKCGQNETCEPIEAMHAEAAEIAERHGGYVNTSESQQGVDTFRDGYAYVPQNSLFAVLDEFDANPAISYDYVDIPASLKGSTFHKQLLTRYPQPGPITVTVKMGESVTEARRHAVAIMGYTDANNLRSVSIFLTQEDLDAYYNHELNHEEALGGQNIDYAYTWLYHIDSGELEGVAMARSPKEVRSAALAEIVGGLHNLRKRDPKRHVKMPRGVNEDIAPETPTPEMIAWFKQRTNRHISLVQKYAKKIADADDRFKDLPAQASTHDASKFEEPEYTPYIYVAWQYKCKKDGVPFEVPQAIKDKMNAATEHHILVNGHHPESSSGQTTGLINANDRDKPPEKLIDGTKMSDLALAEMVCDWMGMAEELGTNPHDWAKKNVNVRWKFTPEQEKLIYQLLDTVWGTGDAKDLEEAKGKKVSQQDVIDNIRATDETGESEFVATLIQDVQRRPNWELRRVNPDDYEYNWYERKDVEDYMGFMAERDDIPPVTIYDNTIMDGSHRAAAAHHLKQKLWAYISTDKVKDDVDAVVEDLQLRDLRRPDRDPVEPGADGGSVKTTRSFIVQDLLWDLKAGQDLPEEPEQHLATIEFTTGNPDVAEYLVKYCGWKLDDALSFMADACSDCGNIIRGYFETYTTQPEKTKGSKFGPDQWSNTQCKWCQEIKGNWDKLTEAKVSIEEVHGEESGVQKFLRYLTYLPNKVVQGIRYYPLERVVDALRRETKAPPKVLNPQWVADLLRSGEVSGALRAPFGGKHPKWWIPQDAVRGIRELLVGRMVDVGLIDVTKYLRTESIIDPTQKTLDQDLFFQEAGEYQPKPEILEYIKKAAEVVFFKYGQPDEFFLKGSTLTFEWLPESDLDVYIVNTKIPDDQLDDAQKWMDELKQPLMQTKHVLEFYIDNQPYNKDNADTIYDLINNAWVKTPKSVHADIEEYLDEFYHVVDELDLDTAELVRDLIDYNILRKLAGPEFKETLEKKVDEINTDVQSLIDQYENVKDARHEVFNRDMTPAEIREYGSKNLLPDNVKFKLLQRYSYLELLKALKKTMETPAGEIEDVDSHEDVAKVAKTLVQKSTSTKVL